MGLTCLPMRAIPKVGFSRFPLYLEGIFTSFCFPRIITHMPSVSAAASLKGFTTYKEERLALFIDGANLYAAAKALEFDIDYSRLLQWAEGQGRLLRAFYYTTLFENEEYSPIRPLVDWLDYNGYRMVTKPVKEYTDTAGRRRFKGSMDIELAVDMMEIADHVDHIMLFTGDGDFKKLVEAVQRKGVKVTVVATIQSNPPMVADELRRQADNFLDLDDLADAIERER